MMIVSLLSGSPKNGIEIMDGVEAMTRGWWRPSPGSIYPLLNSMSKEGTVQKRQDGRYELTPKAHAELEVSFGPSFRKPRTLEEVVGEMGSLVAYLQDLRNSHPQELEPEKARIKEIAKSLDKVAE